MARKRATGAQRPYLYTQTYYVTGPDGERQKKTRQYWRVRIDLGTDANGRRVQRTFTGKTSRECMDKLKAARETLAQTGTLAKRSRKARFGEYLDRFLDRAKHKVAPSTYAHYESIGRRHLDKYRGMLLESFTPVTIEDMLGEMSHAGMSGSYMRQARTILNQTFNLAVRDGALTANPVGTVKVTRRDRPDRKAFTIPEIKAILLEASMMGVEQGAIWWWRFFTGMRQSEILGAELRNLHLDVDHPYYLLEGSLAEIPREHGCGQQVSGVYPCGRTRAAYCPQAEWKIPDGFEMRPLEGRLAIKLPKNGRSRIIPISVELAQVMERYLDAVKGQPNPHGLIFHNPDGGPRLWKQDTREFDDLMERAGLDPRTHTGHETRYSAVTLMRRAGVDRKAELEIVGHVDDRVDDIYMSVDAEQKARAVGAIGEQLKLPAAMIGMR